MSIVINDVAPRIHYVASSGQTVFQVPFAFIANQDLKVYVNEQLATFAAPPNNAMQYSTAGEGTTNAGTITFGPPGRVVNDEVIIFRDMPVARTTDLPTSGVFPVEALNQDFDKTTAMIQQASVNVEKRALRLADFDFMSVLNELPTTDFRRGKVLGFDINGQPILVTPSQLLNLGSGGGTDPGTSVSYLGLIWTDDDPPPPPWADGQLWWQSSTSRLMLWYDDGNSQQWIQINVNTGGVAIGPATPSGDVHIVTTLLTAPSGTWNKTPGARWYRLRGCGGGGSGGGVHTTTNTFAAGAGGGAGGYGESAWFDASGIGGGTYACGAGGIGVASGSTYGGAGGPTTWNDGINTVSWLGGAAGTPHPGTTVPYSRPGGRSGDVTGNVIVRSGDSGEMGLSLVNVQLSGSGGDSPLGRGAAGNYAATGSLAGNNATVGYGGGGSGALRVFGVAADVRGGNGAPGAIYVEEML